MTENEFFAPEIRDLDDALGAIDGEARALVAGLSESNGAWRATPSSWSIAECLDHLAHANRVYLAAMEPAASRAELTVPPFIAVDPYQSATLASVAYPGDAPFPCRIDD